MGHPVGDDTVVWVAPSAEIDEAIIKTKSDVNPNIGEIGNTNSINGIPTKQLNNLYNSSGRDSECLRFIHCIYYTSAARGFIRVLFKIPLNTFIIVRFRLWHLLMKS